MIGQNWFEKENFVMFEDCEVQKSFYDKETKLFYTVYKENNKKGYTFIQEISKEADEYEPIMKKYIQYQVEQFKNSLVTVSQTKKFNNITATEVKEISNTDFRKDAIQYGIMLIEDKIKEYAAIGDTSCYVNFSYFPGRHKDFLKKHGKENRDKYKEYHVESEIKEHFQRLGFVFKLITDDVCDGVLQDPYWTICW